MVKNTRRSFFRVYAMMNDTTWPFVSVTPVPFPRNVPIMYLHSVHSFCLHFNLVICRAYHTERGHSAGIREWSKYMFVSCSPDSPVCLFTCRTSLDCICTSAPSSQHQLHFCGCLTLYNHLWCLYICVCQLVCILTNYFWSFLVSILFGILDPLPTSCSFLSCVIFSVLSCLVFLHLLIGEVVTNVESFLPPCGHPLSS